MAVLSTAPCTTTCRTPRLRCRSGCPAGFRSPPRADRPGRIIPARRQRVTKRAPMCCTGMRLSFFAITASTRPVSLPRSGPTASVSATACAAINTAARWAGRLSGTGSFSSARTRARRPVSRRPTTSPTCRRRRCWPGLHRLRVTACTKRPQITFDAVRQQPDRSGLFSPPASSRKAAAADRLPGGEARFAVWRTATRGRPWRMHQQRNHPFRSVHVPFDKTAPLTRSDTCDRRRRPSTFRTVFYVGDSAASGPTWSTLCCCVHSDGRRSLQPIFRVADLGITSITPRPPGNGHR